MLNLAPTKDHSRLSIEAENKDLDSPLEFLVDISRKGSGAIPKFRYAGAIIDVVENKKAEGELNRQRVREVIEGSRDGIQKKQVCQKLPELGESTVVAHLTALAEAGIIVKRGENRNTRYFPQAKPTTSPTDGKQAPI
jgi:hypothetical protein